MQVEGLLQYNETAHVPVKWYSYELRNNASLITLLLLTR